MAHKIVHLCKLVERDSDPLAIPPPPRSPENPQPEPPPFRPWQFWVAVAIAVPLTWGIVAVAALSAIHFPIIAAAFAGLAVAALALRRNNQ